MRRRIVLSVVPLLILVFLAMSVPGAWAIAGRQTQILVNDRVNDAARFASEALLVIGSGETDRLFAELGDYATLFDSTVWIVDADNRTLYSSSSEVIDPASAPQIGEALSGQISEVRHTVWPWDDDRLSIAVPIGRDSHVIAALVIEVPTNAAQASTARLWGAGGGLLVFAMSLMTWATVPMSRWILRPVAKLDSSAQAVAHGDLSARTRDNSGPPELRGLSRSFNSMIDTVTATLSRQREFVSDASHQLRNPIASLRISVENLEPHLDRSSDSRETFEDALDDLDRMSAVVSGLLAATELGPTSAVPVSIDSALGSAPQRWQSLCQDAGFTWRCTIEPASSVIEPSGGLAAAIDELVSNAIRMSQGSMIALTGTAMADRYLLTVSDDGTGLAESELAQATKRFWRSPATQNVDGTGLGLSILAQAMSDVTGSITVENRPEGGLSVVLDLPTSAPDTRD